MNRKFKNIIMLSILSCLVVALAFAICGNNMNKNIRLDAPESMSNNGAFTPPNMDNHTDNSNSNSNKSNDNGLSGDHERPDIGNDYSMMKEKEFQKIPNDNKNSSFYIFISILSIAISLIVVYLFMSVFNKYRIKDTLKTSDKKIIYILCTIILSIIFVYACNLINENVMWNKSNIKSIGNDNNTATYKSENTITDSKSLSNDTYESNDSDSNAILVKDGNLTANKITVKKTGDSASVENSDFYGTNAGIVVTKGSANIKNSTINTSSKGSNAVFATGKNSKITISDSTINTTGSASSRGLDATNNGEINGDNLKITTDGASSATLATDRGGGKVSVKNSTLETSGTGSPIIYSTGDIEINNVNGNAKNSQMVVVEGKNTATIKNSTLKSSGKGNRGSDNKIDSAGVMIYQSMSGDAIIGKGKFESSDSTLEISSDSDYYDVAPMFFVTNTDALISLKNTKLNYGSGILLSIKGTSEWGNSDSNGGNVTMNLDNEDVDGKIEVDKLSTLNLKLNNTTLKTSINNSNTAKSIKLSISSDSKLVLTGDTYVSNLDDSDSSYSNIELNGYSLYVNGEKLTK